MKRLQCSWRTSEKFSEKRPREIYHIEKQARHGAVSFQSGAMYPIWRMNGKHNCLCQRTRVRTRRREGSSAIARTTQYRSFFLTTSLHGVGSPDRGLPGVFAFSYDWSVGCRLGARCSALADNTCTDAALPVNQCKKITVTLRLGESHMKFSPASSQGDPDVAVKLAHRFMAVWRWGTRKERIDGSCA
eukprot:440513-Amphidinium_carterae.1